MSHEIEEHSAWVDSPEEEVAVATPLDVSVIVSVQNEEADIGEVVRALGSELDRQGRSWEIIFIFDGVGGPLLKAAKKLRETYGKQVKTIIFKNAFGESVCLSAAFEHASGNYIVTSPQYVQVDPIELAPMLEALEEGADFVTPWRHPRVDPLLNRIQSGAFNWIIRHIIRMNFHDLNCYFRAIRRVVLEDIAVYGDMYRFLPVIAHRQGYSVVEVQVRHIKEWGKAGWFGMGVYLRRALDVFAVMFLTKFTLMPLRFFGPVGGVFAFAGFLITGFLSIEKFVYGETAIRPLLLGGMMLIVLGVQIIGFGLVGEIIIFSQARNLREYRIEKTFE